MKTPKAKRPLKNLRSDISRVEVDAAEPLRDTTLPDSYQALSDDGPWEDEPDINLAPPNERSSTPPARLAGVRKRKSGKTVFVAQPTPSTQRHIARPRVIRDDKYPLVLIDRTGLRDAVLDGVSYTAEYVFDVLKTTLALSRKPLSLVLFLYILSILSYQVHSAFRAVFSPLCWIPGISRTPLCYTPPAAPKVPKWADYPKLVEVQGSRFEQLLDDTVGNSGISLDIKRAEMATSDLITLVKVSELKSRETLAVHLEGFVADAKRAGRGLQKLSSRISGAVDNILAVNDYALHTIEETKDTSKSALSIIWPFSSSASVQEVVRDTFTQAMSVLEAQVRRIVLEAEVSMRALDDLEERLKTLHEFVARENRTLADARADLLAELWTTLGGNKKRLRSMNGHLFLLSNINDYRRRATAHVTAALQTLQGMSADMEDLRERVAAPELVGDRIPVEVHLKSIRAGLDRLQADRIRSKEREDEIVNRILGIEEADTEE